MVNENQIIYRALFSEEKAAKRYNQLVQDNQLKFPINICCD